MIRRVTARVLDGASGAVDPEPRVGIPGLYRPPRSALGGLLRDGGEKRDQRLTVAAQTGRADHDGLADIHGEGGVDHRAARAPLRDGAVIDLPLGLDGLLPQALHL